MARVIIMLLLLAAPWLTAAEWTWKTEKDKTLELHGPEGLVWRLNYAKELPQLHFDPLRTGDGVNTTWSSPPDHKWHYGLWYSWKSINGTNYWELARDKSGYPKGRTIIEDFEILEKSPERARIKATLSLRPGKDADPVASEILLIDIETPRADGSYAIDWRQSTTALFDLELGRSSGYGGFSIRGGKNWTEPQFLSSHGKLSTFERHAKVEDRAKWMDMSGISNGKPVGVTFFDHPSNPRHPTYWFLVNRTYNHRKTGKQWPFFYNNAALVGKEVYKLPKGETLTQFYRAYIHPGRGDVETLEAEYQRFSAMK